MQKTFQTEANKGIFLDQYLDALLNLKANNKESLAIEQNIIQKILDMVSPAAVEEAKSALKTITELNPVTQRNDAAKILESIYTNWIAPKALQCEEQTVMSNSSKPVKYNLNVLNNNIKTASPHFGDAYFLYGPSEKRICPKLRGKNIGSDVVSEHTCRHHCLDGIVIDDNKTICGEALWRANVMDKYTRDYTDKEGNITGGYIEKRFEVNHNVDPENKMNLKPGQTRKERPPELGSTESRMQAMRQKEADKRNYKPDSNKGDPFVWDKDVDQNNVEQTKTLRDERENNSGHKIAYNKNVIKTSDSLNTYTDEQLVETLDKVDRNLSAQNDKKQRTWYLANIKNIIEIIKNRIQKNEWTIPEIDRKIDSLRVFTHNAKIAQTSGANMITPSLDNCNESLNELKHIEITEESFSDEDLKPLLEVRKKISFNKFNFKKLSQAPIPIPDDGRPIEPKPLEIPMFEDILNRIQTAVNQDELNNIINTIQPQDFDDTEWEAITNAIQTKSAMFKTASFKKKIA
jgi:hypothetical protein